MTRSLIEAFKIQKPEEKINIIIDEYDHFANELLGFNPEQFRNLVSKNGKVRKWYEILKEEQNSSRQNIHNRSSTNNTRQFNKWI